MSVEAGVSADLCLLRSLALAKSPFLAGHGELHRNLKLAGVSFSRTTAPIGVRATFEKVLHIDMGGALRLETA